MREVLATLLVATFAWAGMVSCAKDNQEQEPQTIAAQTKEKEFHVNFHIKGQHGRTWRVTGKVKLHGLSVEYDITLVDPDGNTFRFKGGSKIKDLSSCTIEDLTGTCTDINGDTIVIDNIEFFLESALREAMQSSESKDAAAGSHQIEENGIVVTDENGDTIQLDSEIMDSILDELYKIIKANR